MIKKGQIVTNSTRTWIGIFDRWFQKPYQSAFWSYCLDPRGNFYKMKPRETLSGAFPTTKLEKEKFKKAALKAGYSYYRGKMIQEL